MNAIKPSTYQCSHFDYLYRVNIKEENTLVVKVFNVSKECLHKKVIPIQDIMDFDVIHAFKKSDFISILGLLVQKSLLPQKYLIPSVIQDIPNAKVVLSQFEQELLDNIDKRAHNISCEFFPKKEIAVEIEVAIRTIRENIYQLLVLPVKGILNYIQTPSIFFSVNKITCAEQVNESLSNPSLTVISKILDEILRASRVHEINVIKEELLNEYPEWREVIFTLLVNAPLLYQASDKAKEQLENYLSNPDVAYCLQAIFLSCPDLNYRYKQMFHGKYSLEEEKPGGFLTEIHTPFYIPKLAALLKALENRPK